jgi:Zn-dependent M28 family amino/carboxypeptidase
MQLAPLLLGATLLAQTPRVQEAPIRAHMAFLADDLLEGRGTGQRGGDLAVRYLEAQLRALGLRPFNGGSFLQRVDLVGVKLRVPESSLAFRHGAGESRPVFAQDVVMSCGSAVPDARFEAPVLFVGYGVAAPQWSWDDFKGVDCRGKLLVMLANQPRPTSAEPTRFGGESLTEYGRWTYKFQEAARRGAAGVLLVHTTEGAGYDWTVARNGFLGEKFLVQGGTPNAPLQGWITEDYARTLLKAGGQDLDALRQRAQSRDFRPVPLELRASAHLASDVRTFPQYNVGGVLEGSDPALKDELVVYSAHWDHLGLQGDRIYNGAVDNGSACAALLAVAQASMPHPARRSQLFLLTCAEEQGLLGANAYVDHPLWPLARTVAALNFESLNWVGPSRDIEFLGGERSTLLELGRTVAREMGLALRPPEPDLTGLYFRSDHYPFARVGIPALSPGFSLAGQRDYLENPEASRAKAATYLQRYHQVTDRYDPSWDLRGMVQQAQFILNLGRRVADTPTRPAMKTDRP